VTAPPTTLHERLRVELDRRLAVARAAEVDGGWESLARWLPPLADYLALHDPADAVRRYTGELEVLERHAIVWRDIGWSEDGDECYEELPVCGRCVPKHSYFPSRAEVPLGACDETKGVASRLGVHVELETVPPDDPTSPQQTQP
jgi:hypothetical protein